MNVRRIVLTAALAAALLSTGACAAEAAGLTGWQAPVAFQLPADAYAHQAQVLFGPGGVATESFAQVQGTPPTASEHFGVLVPGNPYADQLVVATTPQWSPAQAQIAVSADGAAAAAWVEVAPPGGDGAALRYLASYRPSASSSWETPVVLAGDLARPTGVSDRLTLAISSGGVAAVGIQHYAAGETLGRHAHPDYRLDVAVHGTDGSWQAPVRVSPTSDSAVELALAFDAAGDLTAAYAQRYHEGASADDDQYEVIARRLPASGSWGAEEHVSGTSTGASSSAVRLAESPSGSALIAYQDATTSTSSTPVYAAVREGAGGKWATPLLMGAGRPGTALAAGYADQSTPLGYVLFSEQGPRAGEGCVRVAYGAQVAGGQTAFGSQPCASAPGAEAQYGSIAAAGGYVYLAWLATLAGRQVQEQATRLQATAGAQPNAPSDLEAAGEGYGAPTLVPDQLGGAVDLFDSQLGELRAATYYQEAVPLTVALTVPSCASIRSRSRCALLRGSPAAWRTLRGQISDRDPTGGEVTVQVAIYRSLRGHAEGLDLAGRFHADTYARARRRFVPARLFGARWSLRVPSLKAGSYTIIVRAKDSYGFVSELATRTVRLS